MRFVACFVALALSIPRAGGAQENGFINGRVVEATTGTPLSAVAVRVVGNASAAATTNERGRFRIDGVPSGQQTLAVEHVGYDRATVLVDVAASAAAQVEIRLVPVPFSLERLVVTATREERSLIDVPAAVSVVERQELDRQAVASVAEALIGTPSVRVTDYSDGFSQGIQIRSLGESGHFQNAEVLVLVDGVPQLNANSQAFLDQVPFEHVERVEVVRGPSSALYGRNAIAGIVNIITRRPAADPVFGAEVRAGSYGQVQPRVTLGTGIGDRFSFLVAGTLERVDNWRDRTDGESESAFARADLELSAASRLSMTVHYLDLRQRLGTQIPLRPDGSALPVSRTANFNVVPGHRTSNELIQIGASWLQRLGTDIDLTVVGYLRDTDRMLYGDGSFIDAIDEEAQELTIYPFDSELDERIVGTEPRLIWRSAVLGRGHRLTLGGSFETSDGASPAAFVEGPESGPFGELYVNYVTGEADVEGLDRIPSRDGRFDVDNYGAYAQSELDLTGSTRLTTGVRWDQQDRSLIDDLRESNREASFSRVTPKVALNQRLGDQTSIYVSYSEGFNPPFGAAFQFDRQGVESLEPERATNYELGVKAALLERNLQLTAAAFRTERRDLVQTIRRDNENVQVNAGALDVYGLEVEADANLRSAVPGLTVRASYAYADPVWKDYVLSGVDYADKQPMNVSRHVASVAADWQPSRFGAGLWGDYVGGWYMDRLNTVRTDPYAVVNARASWSLPRGVSVSLFVLNILDEDYFTRTEVDLAGEAIAASPGRPRSFQVVAAYRW